MMLLKIALRIIVTARILLHLNEISRKRGKERSPPVRIGADNTPLPYISTVALNIALLDGQPMINPFINGLLLHYLLRGSKRFVIRRQNDDGSFHVSLTFLIQTGHIQHHWLVINNGYQFLSLNTILVARLELTNIVIQNSQFRWGKGIPVILTSHTSVQVRIFHHKILTIQSLREIGDNLPRYPRFPSSWGTKHADGEWLHSTRSSSLAAGVEFKTLYQLFQLVRNKGHRSTPRSS